jgi:hypothetical protein
LSSKEAGHCIPIDSNAEYMAPPDNLTVNGGNFLRANLIAVADAFSQQVMEKSDVNTSASLSVNRTSRQFQPQDIVIVSNGICGSMCSYVTAWYSQFVTLLMQRLYEVLGVQTYSFGGLVGQEVETSGGIKGYLASGFI